MSCRLIASTRSVMLRTGIVAAMLLGTGCAYFHPAFVTQPQQALAPDPAAGVLVCERYSVSRSYCMRVPNAQFNELLKESFRGRY